MCYGIAFKNNKWVSDFNKDGTPVFTENKEEAFRFYNFYTAMHFFANGNIDGLMKEYA